MLEHKQEMAQFAEHHQRAAAQKTQQFTNEERRVGYSGHWAAREREVVHHGCKQFQKLDQDNNILALLWNSTSLQAFKRLVNSF